MASEHQNLSSFSLEEIPNCADFQVGIVVSEWNKDITQNLLDGAFKTLQQNGVLKENISVLWVPGAFELALACQWMFDSTSVHGIIAIGVVIKGETKHFDFVCQGVTQGIMETQLLTKKPISFCLLTDLNKQQSIDRSGGKYGNKGDECAIALIKMIHLRGILSKQ